MTGVLDKLVDMGLVARTRLWRTRGRRVYYRHALPLCGIVFWLAEKYAVGEYPRVAGSLRDTALASMPASYSSRLAELLAEHYGGGVGVHYPARGRR